MAKIKLTRAARHSVALSTGDTVEVRALSALDFSELVRKFDVPTVELTSKLITHFQKGGEWGAVFSDATFYIDVLQTLPDLMVETILLVSNIDDSDPEAVRELPIDDMVALASTIIAISLERIGGLGNLIAALQQGAMQATATLDALLQQKLDATETSS